MRAAVMRAGKLVPAEVPDPVPRSGEVLVRTLACGICGSDLHAFRHTDEFIESGREIGGGHIMDPGQDIVMGHEFCAETVGKGTHPEGTVVCSMPVLLRTTGIETVGYSETAPGGFGELMVLSEPLLIPVPNGLDPTIAALTEPMAVGVHAVERAALSPDDVPLVIGCGPVGLAVIAALKLRGASPIVAADFSPARRALASELGADVVLDPGQESPYTKWRELAVTDDPSRAVDPMAALLGKQLLRRAVIFECVGVPGVLDQIFRAAPRLARVVVVGVCMQQDRWKPFHGIAKELSVQFVLGYSPEEFGRTLYHLAEGRLRVSSLVTGRIGIAGVSAAFDELASPERHVKILVEPSRAA